MKSRAANTNKAQAYLATVVLALLIAPVSGHAYEVIERFNQPESRTEEA